MQTAATYRGEGIQGQPARAAFFVAGNGGLESFC